MKITFPFFLLFTFALLSSCDPFDGKQEVPAYIRVDRFDLVSNPNLALGHQNSDFLTHNITDVWIFVDGSFRGAYPIPCSVPLLYEGNHTVELQPGILLNGIAATRSAYPFYTSTIRDVNLQAGKEIAFTAASGDTSKIMYNTNSIFSIWENFEGAGYHFESPINQDSNIKVYKVGAMDTVSFGGHCGGNFVGAMYLGRGMGEYKMILSDSIVCRNQNGIILELDYWSNVPFEIGIYGQASSASSFRYVSAMVVKGNAETAQKGWKKIYVVLGKVWEQLNQPHQFKVYFKPFSNDLNGGWVYIDNIKIVHF